MLLTISKVNWYCLEHIVTGSWPIGLPEIAGESMVNKSGRKPPAGCGIKGPRPTGHSAANLTFRQVASEWQTIIYDPGSLRQ